MFDTKRLKDETDIGRVVQYCGLDVYRRGNANFILCPNPDHHDERPNNAYFKDGWNNIYCQACGASIQGIDLLMYSLGMEYTEAANTLWEINGCPEWYKKDRDIQKSSIWFTAEELKQVGLKLPGRVFCPGNLESSKFESDKKWDPKYLEHGQYLVGDDAYLKRSDFCDDQAFAELVLQKANEKEKKLTSNKNCLLFISNCAQCMNTDPSLDFRNAVINEYHQSISEIQSVKAKCRNFLAQRA